MGQFTSKKNLKKRKFFNSTVLGYTSNYDNNRISQYHRKDSGFLLLNNKDQKHLIEEPETIFTFNDLLDTHLLYNIQDINLSRMKFKSLTSNIGLLTMITKLNL
ncbi:uncharacterized protein BX663DRAFT_203063 [Cokeromyces recurvatus]|uniref:uncharacterized protein n=1 Tax=Cokeromyces recurvatus TaxID=90255 RepID=UPI002220829B|nr:uncharacterized protein BX663DRAFT_203063 [Cokeromyces recurvatus]KAI7906718.1 hypothetical protein BX663DRAFT_203063 [Cokeromyces recurvatus]